MSEIKCFKLINGQEVIGTVEDETDTAYVIDDTVYWDVVQVEGGKVDIQFSPLTFGAKMAPDAIHDGLKVTLPKQIILFPYEPRVELLQRYKQLVSPILLLNK